MLTCNENNDFLPSLLIAIELLDINFQTTLIGTLVGLKVHFGTSREKISGRLLRDSLIFIPHSLKREKFYSNLTFGEIIF